MVTMIVLMIVVVMVMVMVVMVMAVTVHLVGVGADSFDMVMVAFLRKADLVFETQHLFPVFAHLAVHIACAFLNFDHPVYEGFEHEGLGV